MSNLNPDIHITKSQGIDKPILYVYLAGRIAGNCIDKCLSWRKDIIEHYKNYKLNDSNEWTSYPISFLCPLNSGEANSVDKLGLTSSIPPNLIYAKDILSIEKADVIIANMEDYFEEGISKKIDEVSCGDISNNEFIEYLLDKMHNRRENFGTICEFAIALYLQKPIILIVPENRKEIYKTHPFASRASVIVTSIEQLLKEKWLQILYKSISGATGNY
jgi:nucleoside 2-deoxyribosyltransferase